MNKLECVTIETKTTKEDDRNVTLWINRDGSISLLGGLEHGTKIVIDQKLVNALQRLVDQNG